MKYRKLRIAFSAFCVVVAVLLAMLWVRSYWQAESLVWHVYGRSMVNAIPNHGRISVSFVNLSPNTPSQTIPRLHVSTLPATMIKPPSSQWKMYRQLRPTAAVGFTIPFWFLVVFATASAVVPWLRFSLRTLLIAMTLIALILGLIAWMLRAG